MDGGDRHREDDRHAVRIGDDAVVPRHRVAVDFGHHERRFRIHAERAGVVDQDGAALPDEGCELPGHGRAGTGQHEIDPVEALGARRLDLDALAAERHATAGGPGGCQRSKRGHRKISLLENGQDFLPHDACRSKNGNVHSP
jgi:hypothetical protein